MKKAIYLTVLYKGNVRPVDCFFFKPGAYITHNATYPLSEITWGNSLGYMQLPLEPQKALYLALYFFFPI